MDLTSYLDIIRTVSKIYDNSMCMYCGLETPALGDMAICSNCENIVYMNRSSLAKREQDLISKLDSINESINKSDFHVAISTYDKIVSERLEPTFLYAEALLYIKYSNYEISQISYDKPGFMDENTKRRDSATKQASTAKKFLEKAIFMARTEIAAGNASLNTVYALFLAQRKIGNMRGAREAMELLDRLGKEFITGYVSMVYETEMKNFDKAIAHAESLVGQNDFSINAFYYIAYALFKKGKRNDAKILLETLKPSIASRNVEALINDIDSLSTI